MTYINQTKTSFASFIRFGKEDEIFDLVPISKDFWCYVFEEYKKNIAINNRYDINVFSTSSMYVSNIYMDDSLFDENQLINKFETILILNKKIRKLWKAFSDKYAAIKKASSSASFHRAIQFLRLQNIYWNSQKRDIKMALKRKNNKYYEEYLKSKSNMNK